MKQRISRLTVGQAFGLAGATLGLIAIVFVISGGIALSGLSDARRRLVDRADTARAAASDLSVAMVNEETAVRGYTLTGEERFLAPFGPGSREQAAAIRTLRSIVGEDSLLRAQVESVDAAARNWREEYALPVIQAVRRGDKSPRSATSAAEGLTRFNSFRTVSGRLTARLDHDRDVAREDLKDTARQVNLVFFGFGGLLLLAFVAAATALRRGVTNPIGRLSSQSRAVAGGQFDTPVGIEGLRDTRGLGEDIESLRRRVVDELHAVGEANELLERERADLARSNAELEQFAYVASHDLQEPLRKVASFTQLLQRRYQGELDERADQYIDFAVDGAQRMQQLINDLLAFSRVGRVRDEEVVIGLQEVLDDALKSLGGAIEATGATITHDELPTIVAERTLLTLVFQNLIGNAIKFAREGSPPRIHIGHEWAGDEHRISVQDDGIGIEPEYADRVFVIFQRLHPKDEYPGTGIGLAMCRKIIEHHGGTIRLDTDHNGGGTKIVFTLPTLAEEPQ